MIMIRNPSGRMVPKPAHMKNIPQPNLPGNQKPVFANKIVHKFKVLPGPKYINLFVVKKRNKHLEQLNIPNIEKHDVFEVLSVFENGRNSFVEYENYNPVDTDEWRILSKSVRRSQYDTQNNVNNCLILASADF
jgi:hypothetical protein